MYDLYPDTSRQLSEPKNKKAPCAAILSPFPSRTYLFVRRTSLFFVFASRAPTLKKFTIENLPLEKG